MSEGQLTLIIISEGELMIVMSDGQLTLIIVMLEGQLTMMFMSVAADLIIMSEWQLIIMSEGQLTLIIMSEGQPVSGAASEDPADPQPVRQLAEVLQQQAEGKGEVEVRLEQSQYDLLELQGKFEEISSASSELQRQLSNKKELHTELTHNQVGCLKLVMMMIVVFFLGRCRDSSATRRSCTPS